MTAVTLHPNISVDCCRYLDIPAMSSKLGRSDLLYFSLSLGWCLTNWGTVFFCVYFPSVHTLAVYKHEKGFSNCSMHLDFKWWNVTLFSRIHSSHLFLSHKFLKFYIQGLHVHISHMDILCNGGVWAYNVPITQIVGIVSHRKFLIF